MTTVCIYCIYVQSNVYTTPYICNITHAIIILIAGQSARND